MPLEVIESTDPLTSMIRFETSPVFEMLISLHALLPPDAQSEWNIQTRAALSPRLLQELETVYGPYWNGFLFLELAIDCPDHQDVPGFIRYVRTMTPDRFVFYLVGRMIPVEAITTTGGDADALNALLEAAQFEPGCMCREVPMQNILADVPAFQQRLTDLWQGYWDEFFHTQPPLLRPHWERGLDDKRAVLDRQGGYGALRVCHRAQRNAARVAARSPGARCRFHPHLSVGDAGARVLWLRQCDHSL
ncbi:MAG: DUF5937 family protein [Anaerolineae bacterium]|nr:DUF5937 family protein [Anaerolineae bacterium]